MVSINLELDDEENLFLYSVKLEKGLVSKAEVIKSILAGEMKRASKSK